VIYHGLAEVQVTMRRLFQRTLSVALMGMLLAAPLVLSAQGKKKGSGGRGSRSGGRKKAGTRKKGGN